MFKLLTATTALVMAGGAGFAADLLERLKLRSKKTRQVTMAQPHLWT